MRLKRNSNAQIVVIPSTAPLGRGGEAQVFVLPPDGIAVAKVYHRPTSDHARKLRAMIANPPSDPMSGQGHVSIAWPQDLLQTLDQSARIIAYTMHRVQNMRPLFDFYNPAARRQQCPLFHYVYLMRTARNLAATVGAIHAKGYVIGDVNESNVLVSPTTLITLVDTDSFQVRDPKTGKVFRCPVGKPEFTPPELQGRPFRDIDRSPEHDLFGLAVLLFRLLMEGTHPFDGVYQGTGNPPLHEDRIKTGHFVYGMRKGPYSPKPSAPSFSMLHPRLQQLFLRCFEEGHNNPKARPDAQAWQQALKEAEAALVKCTVNNQHRYSNHLTVCPWCERTKRLGGRDPFPSKEAVAGNDHLKPPGTKPKPPKKPRTDTPPKPTPPPTTPSVIPPGSRLKFVAAFTVMTAFASWLYRFVLSSPATTLARQANSDSAAMSNTLFVAGILSFLYGVLLGWAQRQVLRHYLADTRWWIVATGLGAALMTTLVGLTLHDYHYLPTMTLHPFLGLTIGLSQWMALKKEVKSAGWWATICTLAWFLPVAFTGNSNDGALILMVSAAQGFAASLCLLRLQKK